MDSRAAPRRGTPSFGNMPSFGKMEKAAIGYGCATLVKEGLASFQLKIMIDGTKTFSFYRHFSGRPDLKTQDAQVDDGDAEADEDDEDEVLFEYTKTAPRGEKTHESKDTPNDKPAVRPTRGVKAVPQQAKKQKMLEKPKKPVERKVDKNALSARTDGGGGGGGSSSSTSSRTATPPRRRSGDDTESDETDEEMQDATAADRDRVKYDRQRFERELERQRETYLDLHLQGDIDEEELWRRVEALRERRRQAGLSPDPPRAGYALDERRVVHPL